MNNQDRKRAVWIMIRGFKMTWSRRQGKTRNWRMRHGWLTEFSCCASAIGGRLGFELISRTYKSRAPIEESRKWALYYTVNLLFKTYFKVVLDDCDRLWDALTRYMDVSSIQSLYPRTSYAHYMLLTMICLHLRVFQNLISWLSSTMLGWYTFLRKNMPRYVIRVSRYCRNLWNR